MVTRIRVLSLVTKTRVGNLISRTTVVKQVSKAMVASRVTKTTVGKPVTDKTPFDLRTPFKDNGEIIVGKGATWIPVAKAVTARTPEMITLILGSSDTSQTGPSPTNRDRHTKTKT